MKLSIIIPVYNLERYIEDCLKSCLIQDIDDYEIICINDGSKDNSGTILGEYAIKYPEKIKIIHKQNGGVSSARNEGLNIATGKWVWFVDGDDCIKSNCLGRLIETAELNACDIMSIQNTMFDEETAFDDIMKINSADKNIDNTECIAFKLFKTKIIRENNIKFDVSISHGEDNIFIYEFMKKCNTCYIDTKVVYFYRKRMNSASREKTAENKRKLYKSQIHQVLYYNNEIKNYSEDNYFSVKTLEERRETYLKRALITMCLFETDKQRINENMEKLEQENLYPAKFKTEIVGPLKERMYRFIQNNLGKKSFFTFVWYLKRLVSKGGN